MSVYFFFFSSRRRHTRCLSDWSSDVCSSDLISFSRDDGVTWTRARDTDIPNPGTSLENVRLRNGDWIMVYNDLEQGRYSLLAAVSDDEGATWKWKRHLDGRPSLQVNSQYHYPSVIQARDGAIHVTYR